MTPMDDPELTAYVLGEVEAERARALEAGLAASPERQAEAEATRATAALLQEALASDAPDTALPDEGRAKVLERAAAARPRRAWRWAAGLAAAAALVLSLPIGFWTMSPRVAPERLRVSVPTTLPSLQRRREQMPPEVLERLRALGYVDDVAVGDVADAEPSGTESYAPITDNGFVDVAAAPLSTFAMDVDTASYSNVRRFLVGGQRPPADAVRVEEMVNYFTYDDPAPENGDAFAARVEVAPAPWRPAHRLVRIGLRARTVEAGARPAANLVFLVDVSGSMNEPDKLPLVQQTLRLLVGELDARDHVAIVAYAGAAGLVLPSTSGAEKRVLLGAIDRLRSGGSTNGGAGIQLAYAVARRGYVDGGVNRVILATDGDFNVGVSSPDALERLIVDKARGGVFLSVLGFGTGNYKDSTMEMLADRGNGTCAYIDGLLEARRVMVEQLTASLVTVAKDAKVQVEFNPARVRSYRLIGYENRALRAQDFADDAKDGGEVGAGHTVTALYEVVPAGGAHAGQLLNLKVRYKEPEGRRSRLLEWPVADDPRALERTSDDFRFAAAVAEMAMLLRDSPHRGQATLDQVDALARGGQGLDPGGYRAEFLSLVDRARPLIAGGR